jgi:hypothetical protein
MAFDLVFKLEYFKGIGGASDEGVFIQLKTDVPAYCSKIGKEEYVNGGGDPSDFMDGIFAVPGVVVASSQAFRVYVEKSPLFTWSEVLGPLLEFIRVQVGADNLQEATGSPTTLGSENDRRSP